jgi:hypothetical protein
MDQLIAHTSIMKGNVSAIDIIEGPRIAVQSLIDRGKREVEKSLAHNTHNHDMESARLLRWAFQDNLRSKQKTVWYDTKPCWQLRVCTGVSYSLRSLACFEYKTDIPIPNFIFSSLYDELIRNKSVDRAPFLKSSGERLTRNYRFWDVGDIWRLKRYHMIELRPFIEWDHKFPGDVKIYEIGEEPLSLTDLSREGLFECQWSGGMLFLNDWIQNLTKDEKVKALSGKMNLVIFCQRVGANSIDST